MPSKTYWMLPASRPPSLRLPDLAAVLVVVHIDKGTRGKVQQDKRYLLMGLRVYDRIGLLRPPGEGGGYGEP